MPIHLYLHFIYFLLPSFSKDLIAIIISSSNIIILLHFLTEILQSILRYQTMIHSFFFSFFNIGENNCWSLMITSLFSLSLFPFSCLPQVVIDLVNMHMPVRMQEMTEHALLMSLNKCVWRLVRNTLQLKRILLILLRARGMCAIPFLITKCSYEARPRTIEKEKVSSGGKRKNEWVHSFLRIFFILWFICVVSFQASQLIEFFFPNTITLFNKEAREEEEEK